MIEPTETETPETLELFCKTVEKIAKEIETQPDMVKTAPHTTPVRRLDEVKAAREPQLKWNGTREAMVFSGSTHPNLAPR
jgi:glycine dehydrogenase subunit 2